MRKSPCLILAVLSAGGLLSGFAARRISSGNSSHERAATSVLRNGGETSASADGGTSSAVSKGPGIPHQRSTDTVESVLSLDGSGSYGRIAAWLADASEQDIAAYWMGFAKGGRDSDITELIFIHWTRLNPQAAIAGAAAAGNQYSAWQAWTAHNPSAALAAAIAAGGEQVALVATGIGEFQPAWLRTHLEEIPEAARENALNAMANCTDLENPRESLDFLKTTKGVPDEETFKALVRKDPWAAVDWLKENPMFADQHTSPGNNFTDVLYSILSEERSEELERLADRTPPGDERRKMEQALFDRLLESDPVAALEQARSSEVPLLASQRLAQIGLGLFATDPAKALEIAGEILAANPGNLDFTQNIEFPGGSAGFQSDGKAGQLLDALFNKDHAGTLEIMVSHSAGDSGISKTLESYVAKWAREDLEGFAQWTNQQTGKVRQVGADQVGYRLADEGRYLESIEWAKGGTADPGTAYTSALAAWQKADPAASAAWLENSGLTSEQKAKYKERLKRFSQ